MSKLLLAALAALAVFAPAALATSPGREGRIAFFAPAGPPATGDLVWIRPDGSDRRVLVSGARKAQWSRDGRTLAYNSDDGVYVANGDGTGARRIAPFAESFALSPDRNTLVIAILLPDRTTRNFSIRSDLVAVDIATGHRRRIAYDGEDPVFSPDGRRIAFRDVQRSNPDRYQSIGVVGLNGRGRHLIYRGGNPSGPDWSPDDRRLAWTQFRAGCTCTELRVLTLRGHRVRTLLRGRTAEGSLSTAGLSWSPTGERIVTAEFDGSHDYRLIMVDASSGRIEALPTPQLGYAPAWQPIRR